MRTFAFTLTLLLISPFVHAQSSADRVYKSREFTFYGYDFTRLKLAEPKRTGDDLTEYIFGWMSFTQERITEEKLAAWFRKDKVASDLGPIAELAKKVNGKDLVVLAPTRIEKDSLDDIIAAYPIPAKEGIGMVVVLECFDKATNKTSGYFCFFDCSDKALLLADRFEGKEVDGYGLTAYWGNSLVGTMKNYAADFRNKQKTR